MFGRGWVVPTIEQMFVCERRRVCAVRWALCGRAGVIESTRALAALCAQGGRCAGVASDARRVRCGRALWALCGCAAGVTLCAARCALKGA